MATIKESKKNGKTLVYYFTACLGRDFSGKQIRRYLTWTAPDGLVPSKARKAAERAADIWEQSVMEEFQKEKEAIKQGIAYQIPPQQRKDNFTEFINNVWLPLHVCSGNCKPTTIAYYKNITKIISEYFSKSTLQNITSLNIQEYLSYLRNEYKTTQGKSLASKSIRHHYGTLTNIFGYADKQGLITHNPMQRVDAPKKEKKSVDALT